MNLLAHRAGRIALFTLLYASEGAPIGFIWWALPTLARADGLSLSQISGTVALLVLPWIFKFLWAPLVDSFWNIRGWIITAQWLMGLTLIPLLFISPSERFELWRLLLLMHAVCAATQDAGIDALAIRVTPQEDRGILNGCMQAGMLMGRSFFGGGAILFASYFGWQAVVAGLIVCIWSTLVLMLFVREPERPSKWDRGEFASSLREVLGRRTTWFGIGFALTAAAAFELAGALTGPFLLDHSVPRETIGLFLGIPVVLAMLVGGLAGGLVGDRIMGHGKTAGTAVIGFVVMIAVLGAVDSSNAGSTPLFLVLLTFMYLFIGLFTAASYALFMDLTDNRLGATQFSAFMAATNGCEAWSTFAGGRVIQAAGYAAGFWVMCAVSLLSLPLLYFMRARSLRRL